MVCYHDRNGEVTVVVALAAHFTDGGFSLEQVLGGNPAQGQDQPGLNGVYLLCEIIPAGQDFLGPGVAIIGRAAFQDIGDKNLFPGKADCLKHGIKQLARPADEGFAAPVLLGARRLADQHPVCIHVTHPKHRLRPAFVQLAQATPGYLTLQSLPIS